MLDVKTAATRIGISTSLLYQLVRRRAIEHVRIGSKILFEEPALDRYLESCRVGVAAKPTAAAAAAAATPPRQPLRHLKV